MKRGRWGRRERWKRGISKGYKRREEGQRMETSREGNGIRWKGGRR